MTAQTLQQRAEIERVVGDRTLCDLLDRTAAESGDAPAFSTEAGDGWQTLTWAQTRQQVLELAAGFTALGLAPGERVAPITMEDPAALLYTSGTRGNPKGVLLTHHNIEYELACAAALGVIPPEARWVSYLPLAHTAERI